MNYFQLSKMNFSKFRFNFSSDDDGTFWPGVIELPVEDKEDNNKKVIRGGSWKDVKYFLQVGSRDYEYADKPRSYIGFRTVHDYLGADLTANAMTNSAIRKQNNRKSSIK